MEEGQKWDGKKFESEGAGVHAGVRVARPKPTTMGKPVENPWDAVAEAIVVIWLVKQATDKGNDGKEKKGSGEEQAKGEGVFVRSAVREEASSDFMKITKAE